MENGLATAFKFEWKHQGGNIWAWQRDLPDGRFILITEDEEDDGYVCACWLHDGDECVSYVACPTLEAAFFAGSDYARS